MPNRFPAFLTVLTGVLLLPLLVSAQSPAAAGPPWPDGTPPPTRTVPRAPQTTYTVYLNAVHANTYYFAGPEVPFAYGWGVFDFRAYQPNAVKNYGPTSFGWLRVTDNPAYGDLCGTNKLTKSVLLRLNHAEATTTPQYVADRAWEWAINMKDPATGERCVEAFEIGNEPNLSGPGLYNGPVNPELFADQLCAAYDAIKAADPAYLVVSGGLAPTGDIGDPANVMDEEDFLRAMLDRIRDTRDGDAGACFDVLGYHNYGFRVSYDHSPDDEAGCPSGMCFRGAELIHKIMWSEYGVHKRIWSTELGWLRDFMQNSPACSSLLGVFAGFQNTDQEQADELVGAFQYARAHWPWTGGMFVFNLDFNQRPWWQADRCSDEQGWFAVQGESNYETTYAAKVALEEMEKP